MSRNKVNGFVCFEKYSDQLAGKGDTLEEAWSNFIDNGGAAEIDGVIFYRLGEKVNVEMKIVEVPTEVLPK